jgi:hypothetical protein
MRQYFRSTYSIYLIAAGMFITSLSFAVENSKRQPPSANPVVNKEITPSVKLSAEPIVTLDATQVEEITASYLDNTFECDGSSATDRGLQPFRKIMDETEAAKKMNCQDMLSVVKEMVAQSKQGEEQVAQSFRIYIDINRMKDNKPHYKAVFVHSNPTNASLKDVRSLLGPASNKVLVLGAD